MADDAQASRTLSSAAAKSIWNDMDVLFREFNPVDLGVGCPNSAIPSRVRQDLIDAVDGQDYSVHQYTRGFGHPRLTKALSSLYGPLLGREQLDPALNVMVTWGASDALFTCIMGLVNPGDEVIIIEPFYDSFLSQVLLAEGVPVFVPLRPKMPKISSSADWLLDIDELEKAFTTRTKALILNTPHNPTGKVFSRTELEDIAALCRKKNVVVFSDEVYEWIVHDDLEHVRFASLPGMWERTVTLGSAGKTFSVTGWKIGWAIGPSNLLQGPKYVHQNYGYIICTPVQEALARSFERETRLLREGSSDCYFKELQTLCQKKRDQIACVLEKAGLHPIVPQGGYFILADVRDIMSKVEVGGDPTEPKDVRFVKWLVRNRKLQGIPPSAFFSDQHKSIGEDYVRFCFFKNDRTLDQAIPIILNLTSGDV
ncbi:Aminotransferase class I/classII [Trinorchestia longiramus]|nr:Aminotransferase class I/classII [Trinorchestia longiramus]